MKFLRYKIEFHGGWPVTEMSFSSRSARTYTDHHVPVWAGIGGALVRSSMCGRVGLDSLQVESHGLDCPLCFTGEFGVQLVQTHAKETVFRLTLEATHIRLLSG